MRVGTVGFLETAQFDSSKDAVTRHPGPHSSLLLSLWLQDGFSRRLQSDFQTSRLQGSPQNLPPPPARSPRSGSQLLHPSALGGYETLLATMSQSHQRRGTRGASARVPFCSRSLCGPKDVSGPGPAGWSRGPGLSGAVLWGRRRVQDPLRSLCVGPGEVLGQSCWADQLVQALDQNAREQIPAFHQLVSDLACSLVS
jgi:hypothetical protein